MSQVPVDTFIDEEIDRQERCRMLWVNHYRGWVIFFTLLIFLPFLFLQPENEFRCLYMFMVMAVFWITEVIPPGITALMPVIGLPVFGYVRSIEACTYLFQSSVVLFIASLLISMAIESSNLHTRMGLCLVKVIGPKPRILMLFFMCFTAFFSMLLPNTLITALMCPILKAVLEELGTQGVIELVQPGRAKPEEEPYPSKMVMVFYLSVAYSASIGGLAFLTSTGTHPVFKKLFEASYKDDHSFDFKRWAGMGLPLAVVCLFLVYIWLQFFYFGMGRPNSKRAQLYKKTPEELAKAAEGIKERRLALGKMSRLECQIVMVLLLMFVLVVTMKPMFVPGYDDWLNAKEFLTSAPVMICACALFILPINYGFLRYCCCKKPDPVGERENLLAWRFVHKNMLWNMMLVFAGSFGLATALEMSGLAKAVVIHTLSVAKGWPGMLLQLCCILMGIFSTAFIINVGMAAVLTPIMIEFAKTTDWHVGYLTVPIILALSMAFLFPFSTPANAIVAGRGNIRTKDMFVAGIGPTLIGILMILFCCNTWMFLMWSYFKGKIPAADDG